MAGVVVTGILIDNGDGRCENKPSHISGSRGGSGCGDENLIAKPDSAVHQRLLSEMRLPIS
ncbi:hypothetical protein [Rhizobium grahamii]|uniref:hypothetical protein n=1 Tax=Rhizobium grahamii TaxID=1120045 RepID=UPI003CC8120F